MGLVAGVYSVLKVERDSPFGYFLSDGEEDVLLHYLETNQQKINIGDHLEVFLYSDHKGRIAATLDKPKIILGEVGFLEVKDYQAKMGFFLNNGLSKQVLLPIADLPEDKSIWPEEDDLLLVKLVHDKQERLLATLVKSDEEITEYLSEKSPAKNIELKKNQFIDGIVILHLSEGAKILLDNNQIGFIHRNEQLQELRLGQRVRVRITYTRQDGRINLSMKQLKNESRLSDADKILAVLKERGGSMPYWDKTAPDIIMEKFGISKAAFKRALGKLMKDEEVYQENGWTYLKK